MREIAAGVSHPQIAGLRHDVDNEIESSVHMAVWEHERGYRSTYYILHTADYWQDKQLLKSALEIIHECGHEIGFHIDSITEAIRTGRDPREITLDAVNELREYGYPVSGVVAHGASACYAHNYVNDELFTESARPSYGAPDRVIADKVKLNPVSRRFFRFTYDPNQLSRGVYLSDSGGKWSQSFDEIVDGFGNYGQLHLLVHCCWWAESFLPSRAAA